MKTITVTEALNRVAQVIPEIRSLENDLTLLVHVRNGVAHAGRVEAEVVGAVLVPYFKACGHIVDALEIERPVFWGEFVGIVETRLSDSVKEAEIRATEAIAAARLAFDGRFSAIPEDMRKAVLKMIEDGYRPESPSRN